MITGLIHLHQPCQAELATGSHPHQNECSLSANILEISLRHGHNWSSEVWLNHSSCLSYCHAMIYDMVYNHCSDIMGYSLLLLPPSCSVALSSVMFPHTSQTEPMVTSDVQLVLCPSCDHCVFLVLLDHLLAPCYSIAMLLWIPLIYNCTTRWN